ncbi:MAG: ACP S-malonyltransferase [Bacillota bacterium]
MFPGQGSQFPGMGSELCRHLPYVRRRLEQASAVTGLDLIHLVCRADGETLARPDVAQVAVYALSTAVAEYLMEQGLRPWAVVGHSLGEYSALVVAGCLDWERGLRLVWLRGQAMAEAAAACPGTMAAVMGLSDRVVADLCRQAAATHGCVVVANYNSPVQVVISGAVAAVEAVSTLARQAGALSVRFLAVGGAYHSPLMAPAQARLAPHLDRTPLGKPQVLLASSTTGDVVVDPEVYRQNLLEQITRPVLWRHAVGTLLALGATEFVEVGPGRVLCGLVRQIAPGARTATAGDMAGCQRLIRQAVV